MKDFWAVEEISGGQGLERGTKKLTVINIIKHQGQVR